MAESRHTGRPGGFLSAVVADSRAMMPRRPAFSDHDVDGPPAIASDAMFVAPLHGEASTAPHPARAAPGIARSWPRSSLPPYVAENPAAGRASSVEAGVVEMPGQAFEAGAPDTAVASERRDEHELAPIDPPTDVSTDVSTPSTARHEATRAARRSDVTAGVGPVRPEPLEVGRLSETSTGAVDDAGRFPEHDATPTTGEPPSPARHTAPSPRASHASPSSAIVDGAAPHLERTPVAGETEVSGANPGHQKGATRLLRHWGEAASHDGIATAAERGGTPDASARTSDGEKAPTSARASVPITAPTAAQSAVSPPSPAKPAGTATISQAAAPAAPRAPMNLTRPQRAAAPAPNSTRPPTAPPSVHIGTIDVRIEAPKPRAEAPPRQPVSFSGSGMLSRLYLRRM